MNDTRRGLSIHFTDGGSISFEFPTQLSDPATITQHVENLLKDRYIMVEAEGALLLYPLANIRSLQVSPAPAILPQNCIKGARITD
jgi:hypothetical protein